MTDNQRDPLEDRLRAEADQAGCGYHRDLYREAADEIKRLRAALGCLMALDQATAALDALDIRDADRLTAENRALQKAIQQARRVCDTALTPAPGSDGVKVARSVLAALIVEVPDRG